MEGDPARSAVRRSETISIHALRVEGDWIVKTLMLEGNDFYPRPPGGGRRRGLPRRADRRRISIHALRVEGDVGNILSALPAFTNFYPRPPGGGRPGTYSYTLAPTDFYPRPPGGGRPEICAMLLWALHISIHALRVEGDRTTTASSCISSISIHALRVEGD